MSHNPTCTIALHSSLTTSPEFTRLLLVGYQLWPATAKHPADVVELRRCSVCGSTLAREMEIGVRLELARKRSEMAMIARCRRALTGDREAIAAYVSAVEMDRLMGGVR